MVSVMMDGQILLMVLGMLGVGALAGFSAGLFGIGGGAVLVPALYFVFTALGVPQEVLMHMAVATSMAVIIISSLRSASAHNKKGAVDWELIWHDKTFCGFVKGWGFWIGLGSLFASLVLARYISGQALVLLFGIIASLIALQLVFGRPNWRLADHIPSALTIPAGFSLGGLCALMGIGFGSFGVTFMLLFGRKIHRAIATAAALGVFISIPATIGFIISGQGVAGRPEFSLGYVNLPGFVIIAIAGFVFAPLGVRAAHALAQEKLRRLFGICLLLIALNMLGKSL